MLVVLLDLSAEFDTVEHTTLLDILRTRFGITGSALNWHKSYLSDRSYRVVTGGVESNVTDLDCGLPQGSSLGPLKFIAYASGLQEVANRHGILFHGFADDSQLSKHNMLVSEIHAEKRTMVDCITDIELWCRSHGLKLNADKSDVIWLGIRQQFVMINQADMDIHLPSGILRSSETARNLGVTIDQQMKFDTRARACSRSCFYQLRRIRQIRRFIDDRTLRLRVHAFVTSRLDYCNGLLANCSVSVRQRFQRIQNCAAHLVCSEPALSHATLLLRRLHWLPVARHISYKLCVLMFDVFHGTAPTYLTDICSHCSDNRLQSSACGNFVVWRTRRRFADSSFAVAGPAAWNSLPVNIWNIRSHTAFCRQLKTYLFTVPD